MPRENLNSKRPLYIPYAGNTLLELPLLNKGSAFTEEERRSFNLHGLIPHVTETIEEQSQRSYQQYCAFNSDINKHIYFSIVFLYRNYKIFYKVDFHVWNFRS